MKIGWSGKKAYDENSSEYSLLSDIRLIGEPVIAKRYCYVRRHFPLYFFTDNQNQALVRLSKSYQSSNI